MNRYMLDPSNKPKPTFNPRIDVEKGKMFLVRSGNEDEGEMIWMEKATSDIFQDDDSEIIHVKFDWWQPSLGKYKEIF